MTGRRRRAGRLLAVLSLLTVGLMPVAPAADTNAGPGVDTRTDPVTTVRATPSVVDWLANPSGLLAEQPIAMTIYDPKTNSNTPAGTVADCSALAAAQAAGHYPVTSRGMAMESLAASLCALNARYEAARFERIEGVAPALGERPLERWSAWFQLAAIPNVADAIAAAVERGTSLAEFTHPSTEGCGAYAMAERDAVSFTARNTCDESYVLLVGQEVTAAGRTRPIVFYILAAVGGSLRVAGYAAVDRHPDTGVWTPVDFLGE